MCPEMINDEMYDEKADMWSFGVIAYILVFGGFPYGSKSDDALCMRKAIVKGTPPKFLPVEENGGCRSGYVTAFVAALLDRDPDVRPSAKDVLKQSYMHMIQNSCYMPGAHLMSLQPMLSLAVEVGKMELYDLSQELSVDLRLSATQVQPAVNSLRNDKIKPNYCAADLAVEFPCLPGIDKSCAHHSSIDGSGSTSCSSYKFDSASPDPSIYASSISSSLERISAKFSL